MKELCGMELACALSSLAVFRNVLNSAPMQALLRFLTCNGEVREKISLFGDFVFSLAEDQNDFSAFLQRAVFEDENVYVKAAARHETAPPSLAENARHELQVFTHLSTLTPAQLCAAIRYDGFLPQFENHFVDFEKEYQLRLQQIDRYGYGVFSSAAMFYVADGKILPVRRAAQQEIESFVGYEEERRKVFDNTKALCEGRPAANVLLFGDAGTGKSSTVKACVKRFFDQGVRLIELRKDQLLSLSSVMEKVADNPLKFIIFIDDLSFNKNDDSFSMLKAALEGSVATKAPNAVIYATSNRRHIVKESFSDRESGDDIHRADTTQELMSLSDRFGLTVYFAKPDKQLYLQIVHCLARKNGLEIDPEFLEQKAEEFALRKGSRSPRAAEQLIQSLMK